MTELRAEDARRAIVDATARLAEAAATAGPDAVVPTAPGWTVRDLVEHVGQTHDWVATIVEQRIADPADLPTQFAILPADPDAWPGWLAGAARRAVDACSDDALDAPVWNAAGDDRTGTEFWMASVLNESVVHGADAAAAAGRTEPVEAVVAGALIDNHLRMLTSPTWAAQRSESATALRGTGQRLQWRATDLAGDAGGWSVERGEGGATWESGARPADVTVRGPAGSLLLLLTRRLPIAEHEAAGVVIDGDAGLVRHWIDNTAHVAD